jgi:hypothetical protein
MLQAISADKVAQVIVRAREMDARVGAWEVHDPRHPDEETPEMVLEALRNDPARSALASLFTGMNADELSEVVALMWIGRGTFEPEEWEEALATAREEHPGVAGTTRYLLKDPLLADYLEEGLDRLGYSIEELEADVR